MIDTRIATTADVSILVGLLEELDRFYGVTEFAPTYERERQVHNLLFGEPPAAHVLLATDGPDVVGLASYSYLWPAAGVTASLYLKELYVKKTHRRKGIGRQIMGRLFRVAHESGCSRVEWTTDRDNDEAQAM